MFCTKCGEKMVESVKFCQKCGTSVESVNTAQHEATAFSEPLPSAGVPPADTPIYAAPPQQRHTAPISAPAFGEPPLPPQNNAGGSKRKSKNRITEENIIMKAFTKLPVMALMLSLILLVGCSKSDYGIDATLESHTIMLTDANSSSPSETPAPAPIAPAPVAPTPVAPAPVAPTPIAPPPLPLYLDISLNNQPIDIMNMIRSSGWDIMAFLCHSYQVANGGS